MIINRENIITTLKKNKFILQNEMGVKNLALFGSYANNVQREDSDIDFLIELKEISYKNLYQVYAFLEKKFPEKKIQLIRTGPHLSEKFLRTIEKDLIYV